MPWVQMPDRAGHWWFVRRLDAWRLAEPVSVGRVRTAGPHEDAVAYFAHFRPGNLQAMPAGRQEVTARDGWWCWIGHVPRPEGA